MEEKRKKRFGETILVLVLILTVILLGKDLFQDKNYYLTGILILCLTFGLFLIRLEKRNVLSGELVLIAIMSALAVLGRTIFFMLPFIKPMAAIVLLTGMGFGIEAGFLTGAISAFLSNFFFGQGPWTPWQMFAYGILGIIGGILWKDQTKASDFQNKKYMAVRRRRSVIIGSVATIFIYGGIMDVATVWMSQNKWNQEMFFAIVLSGFFVNVIHGISTGIFLYFLEIPILTKMMRIKKKYGYYE